LIRPSDKKHQPFCSCWVCGFVTLIWIQSVLPLNVVTVFRSRTCTEVPSLMVNNSFPGGEKPTNCFVGGDSRTLTDVVAIAVEPGMMSSAQDNEPRVRLKTMVSNNGFILRVGEIIRLSITFAKSLANLQVIISQSCPARESSASGFRARIATVIRLSEVSLVDIDQGSIHEQVSHQKS
jgi:hypothetical protein